MFRSCRVYKLVGPPGHNSDGDYVWGGWKKINHVETEKDVSEEVYASCTKETKAEKEIITLLKEKIVNVESQSRIWSEKDSRHYIYDIKVNDKVIEYNGDYWHANPKLFSSDDLVRCGITRITAREKWICDSKKAEAAHTAGLKLKVIWESDYKKDKQKVIEECITFLTK